MRSPILILGIDPGPEQSGWVALEDGRVIECRPDTDNDDAMLSVISHYSKAYLAIEQIASYGMAVGESTFETVYWSGRFAEAWLRECPYLNQRVIRIPRIDIKMHLCHDSRAKDANIRQALIDRLGPPGTKQSPGATYGVTKHAWAALAVAVTAAETRLIRPMTRSDHEEELSVTAAETRS